MSEALSFAKSVYEAVDSMDETNLAKFLTDECTFAFGNAKPVVGRAAVAEASKAFLSLIAGIKHEINDVWGRLIPLTQVALYVVSERSASARGIARKPGHGAGPFARRVSESIRRRGELRHVSVQASLARRLRVSRLRQAPRQCA